MTSKETGATSNLVLRPPAPAPAGIAFFEAGGEKFHHHNCPIGPHPWDCNSPYCATLNDNCPDHGGDEPIKVGREPWRR